jgi:DNA/RNA endonuclease YhcR with UshA esterase domain
VLSIAQAKLLGRGHRVATRGQVTAEPDILGRGVLYLQDHTGGLRIYLRQGRYPPLVEGDWVRVEGVRGEYYGMPEVVLADPRGVRRLSGGGEVEPLPITASQVGSEVEGLLVRLSGAVAEREGAELVLQDGSGRARFFVRRSTGVEISGLDMGQLAEVVGIVALYEREFWVYPRRQGDIILLAVALPETGSSR